MAMIKTIERYTPADFDVLGIPPENFDLLTQDDIWRVEHKLQVIRTFQAVVFGSLQIMGLPPIVVPTEYIAAVVATLVSPSNQKICCVWLSHERMNGTGAPAITIAAQAQPPSQWDPHTADQLFALVCLLHDTDETNYARIRFKERLGVKLTEAEKKVQP